MIINKPWPSIAASWVHLLLSSSLNVVPAQLSYRHSCISLSLLIFANVVHNKVAYAKGYMIC